MSECQIDPKIASVLDAFASAVKDYLIALEHVNILQIVIDVDNKTRLCTIRTVTAQDNGPLMAYDPRTGKSSPVE